MSDLLLHWVLPIIGLVYVLGYSSIFAPIRKSQRTPTFLRLLLDCPMCIGFWVGGLVGLINWMPVAWPRWVQLPAIGAVSAVGVQYLIEVFGREP